MNDLLGLGISKVPADFLSKWTAYYEDLKAMDGPTAGLAAISLAILALWPKITRKVPAPLVAMLAATGIALLFKHFFHVEVETIGSRFGEIPNAPPAPHLPAVDLLKVRELMGPAATIAILAAIESLLSAVVADGMIGGRHKANMELVAQGVANIASPLFGGIPATGAIARTATNVKSGGRTPVAGMIHAVTLLLIMVFLAPLAVHIPLCALAAVLVVVAYHMADVRTFAALLRSPRSDAAVLLITFALTVIFDLTLAVEVGLVMAAFLFIKRMADVTNVAVVTREINDQINGEEADPNAIGTRAVPAGVEVYEVNGPFFFGVADKVKDVLRRIGTPPRAFILRMRHVPAMDATGMHALLDLRRKCEKEGIAMILSEIHSQPLIALERAGHLAEFGEKNVAGNIDEALDRARELLV